MLNTLFFISIETCSTINIIAFKLRQRCAAVQFILIQNLVRILMSGDLILLSSRMQLITAVIDDFLMFLTV